MKRQSKLSGSWRMGFFVVVMIALLPVPSLATVPGTTSSNTRMTLAHHGTDVALADPGPSLALEGLPAQDSDWWTTVQAQIVASEYHVTWQDQTYLADVEAAYQAPNREQNLRFYFTSENLAVIPRVWPDGADTAPWRWDLCLVAWGREGALQPTGAATVETWENHLEYRWPALVESYRNEPDGLEQGFTLHEPPAGEEPGAALQLDLFFGGNLTARVSHEGAEVEFLAPDGQPAARYRLHQALDATGRSLLASLSLRDATLSLQVDDAAAVYPIEVDSIIEGLSTTSNWYSDGDQAGAEFGWSVATAGDVDDDGYSDVIIGAPKYDHGQTDEGRVFVYHGSATGLEATASWDVESDQAGAQLGYSVATAGDVDGDGYSDALVAAPAFDGGQEDEGAVWLYTGGYLGLHDIPSNYDEGNQEGAWFGTSVATAGDVNGDGYSDIIVGAPLYANGASEEGRAWVWHGSSEGVSPAHDWRAESNQVNGSLGLSVATAGDVNGDGFADVIIGAQRYSHGQTEEGVALVWHGSPDGVNWDVNGDPTNAAWMGEVNAAGARFGYTVSTAGDVNGDGYSDVIVGAPYYYNGQTQEGGAWVYHGSSTGLSTSWANQDEGNQAYAQFGKSVATAGDVNGDGYADVIVGAPGYTNSHDEEGKAWVWHGSPTGISVVNDWSFEANQIDAWFGRSVATAGDVNGDGFSDVIVGAYGGSAPEAGEGLAYVFHGSADSLAAEHGWTERSNQANARFGWSVATAGDVNGDGYADVIVGAPRWDDGQVDEGGAWVYEGSMSGLETDPAWYKRSNSNGAWFGHSVATAGDVNGDGYEDVIVGAPAWSSIETDAGWVFIYPGSDTGLESAPLWSRASVERDTNLGWSVGTAGDVNGDGYADVIVGVPGLDLGLGRQGSAHVWHGSDTGPPDLPDWALYGDTADMEFGTAVGTAGDVNGDGYSDIIVGAPYYTNGQTEEGVADVYLGSRGGLSMTPVWTKEADLAGAEFGTSVGTAGDVNGDGYSDVIVGGPGWSVGQNREGGVWVYHGMASGVVSAPAWHAVSNQDDAELGYSVATAGDVNGDGYSDIVIGARYWTSSQTYEGGAWLYHGSASGLRSSSGWGALSGQMHAFYGWSVAGAGDVNGDGYNDVVVGAPFYNDAHLDEGMAFVYYGNDGPGRTLLPRQLRYEGSGYVLIAPLGSSGDDDSVEMSLGIITPPFGKGKVALEFEVKPLGTPFDGNNTLVSMSWYDSSPGGFSSPVALETSLTPGRPYHWRARHLYHPGEVPFQRKGPWMTGARNGWQETDFRTTGGGEHQVFLPIVLRDE